MRELKKYTRIILVSVYCLLISSCNTSADISSITTTTSASSVATEKVATAQSEELSFPTVFATESISMEDREVTTETTVSCSTAVQTIETAEMTLSTICDESETTSEETSETTSEEISEAANTTTAPVSTEIINSDISETIGEYVVSEAIGEDVISDNPTVFIYGGDFPQKYNYIAVDITVQKVFWNIFPKSYAFTEGETCYVGVPDFLYDVLKDTEEAYLYFSIESQDNGQYKKPDSMKKVKIKHGIIIHNQYWDLSSVLPIENDALSFYNQDELVNTNEAEVLYRDGDLAEVLKLYDGMPVEELEYILEDLTGDLKSAYEDKKTSQDADIDISEFYYVLDSGSFIKVKINGFY